MSDSQTENSQTENGVLVETHALTKVYRQGSIDVPALGGVDLTVRHGEFCVLAGSSGSGKTTLLNLIGALDRPTAGSIHVDGRDLARMGSRDLAGMRLARIGFVF